MIVREPPPSRMKQLRSQIHVRPRLTPQRRRARPEPQPQGSPGDEGEGEREEPRAEVDEESLAEALRGTFPASDPPSSWAG